MKWFDDFILRRAEQISLRRRQKEGYNEAAKVSSGLSIAISGKEDPSQHGEDPIRFELSAAVGGRILQVRRYDRRTDRNDSATYVIPSGDDVGERVTKIINLELLK